MRLNTDLDSHHIEGFTNATNEYIKIPLITEVMENFWQGGCVGGVHLPDDFKYVLSLYEWEEYKLGAETERNTVTMYDGEDVPPKEQIDDLATWVNEKRALGKTLVHCQAGLNRSGLIAARALMLSGYTADSAISLLRETRSSLVLCNDNFEQWLREVK